MVVPDRCMPMIKMGRSGFMVLPDTSFSGKVVRTVVGFDW